MRITEPAEPRHSNSRTLPDNALPTAAVPAFAAIVLHLEAERIAPVRANAPFALAAIGDPLVTAPAIHVTAVLQGQSRSFVRRECLVHPAPNALARMRRIRHFQHHGRRAANLSGGRGKSGAIATRRRGSCLHSVRAHGRLANSTA